MNSDVEVAKRDKQRKEYQDYLDSIPPSKSNCIILEI